LGPGGVSEDWRPDYSQMDGPQQEMGHLKRLLKIHGKIPNFKWFLYFHPWMILLIKSGDIPMMNPDLPNSTCRNKAT
jgi:hypothetical protein